MNMFYYVYILQNFTDKRLYIGFSSNLKQRIKDHLEGKGSKITKNKKDWVLIYFEGYKNKKDALAREIFLKSGSGRRYINKHLFNYLLAV